MTRRGLVVAVGIIALAAPSCRKAPPARTFPLAGQVLAVKADGREITIRHDEVKGLMPAMTMPFKVKDPALTRGRLPGDLVKGTLAVTEEEAWLVTLEKTGWAPFPTASTPEQPAFELLRAGEPLPDATLVGQDGTAFRLSSLRGSPVLLTFIYTRCPLPNYCPLMDRNFQALQKAIKEGRLPAGVRLLSVSFDPDFDTPAVLKAHAAQVGADPHVWTFATAPRGVIDALGGPLGLSVIREPQDPASITHNLRTAIVDRQGRLVSILNGNDWTPEQAVSALASVPGS